MYSGLRPHGWTVWRRGATILALALLISSTDLAVPRSHAAETPPAATAATFVSLLAAGKFRTAESVLTPEMQAATPEGTLRAVWTGLVTELGAFRHQSVPAVSTVNSVANVTVRCSFARGTADLVVSVDQSGKVVGFHIAAWRRVVPYTAPGYVHRAAFTEHPVTVGQPPWALPGTLTLPNGRGPFPAVVLVAGSGPMDRDETYEAVKPFRDLAWGLASQGIAVLRYDKRTLVYGGKIAAMTNFTVQDEYVSDAVAAAHLLTQTSGINHHAIFILGHSGGGMMAPRIVRRSPGIAGVIMMAAPTRPLVDVILAQYVYLESRRVVTAEQLAAARQQAAEIKALTPMDRGTSRLLFGAYPTYWLGLRSYHPTTVARQLSAPILIMQGARDYQVTVADFDGWKSALRGHGHVTFRRYPNLFHPFIPVPAGSVSGLATPAAYAQPGHVAPTVVRDLTSWIKASGR